jgi:hypothetical protein
MNRLSSLCNASSLRNRSSLLDDFSLRSSISSAVSLIDTLSGPRSTFLFDVEVSDLLADLSEPCDDFDDDWLEDAKVPEELVNDPESDLQLLTRLRYESRLLDVGLFDCCCCCFFFFFFRAWPLLEEASCCCMFGNDWKLCSKRSLTT